MSSEMILRYERSVDAFYIKLKEDRIVESDEVAPGIIIDYNDKGEIVGVEVLQFSKRSIDIKKLITEGIEALLIAVRIHCIFATQYMH
ncbi:Protein of unknown function DUF2283 [Ignisphaera aggregans DSM 17230]|uniref:DUF2283 domain-containing protein n=1 Tax=Ignisphaera aggregans (strain DSM 17230 / JCM 13409 / AQ1.S1) TaxID=583356 RepID=E0STJ3_IGNAA|nr:Protein of unknown function DUF2283 [Ignisphaera aggregans DSM 17230]